MWGSGGCAARFPHPPRDSHPLRGSALRWMCRLPFELQRGGSPMRPSSNPRARSSHRGRPRFTTSQPGPLHRVTANPARWKSRDEMSHFHRARPQAGHFCSGRCARRGRARSLRGAWGICGFHCFTTILSCFRIKPDGWGIRRGFRIGFRLGHRGPVLFYFGGKNIRPAPRKHWMCERKHSGIDPRAGFEPGAYDPKSQRLPRLSIRPR